MMLFGLQQQGYSQSCAITNYDELIPDLYPVRTIRVAFHVIHKNTVNDNTNVSNNSNGDDFWNEYVDSINHVLGNLGHPNYFFHNIHYRYDAKIRIELYAVYHHADSELFNAKYSNGTAMNLITHPNELRSRLIINNNALSTYEKEQVLPIFYYGDPDNLGGLAFGAPSREGIRLEGAGGCYSVWDYNDTLQYKYVGNFIHELLHTVGLRHNQYLHSDGTSAKNYEYVNSCDYSLDPNQRWHFGDPSHENLIDTFLNNNFLYKYELGDKSYLPGYHLYNSMSYCQIQRSIWNAWNFPNYSYNSSSNISQCVKPLNPCPASYTAEIIDGQILNYDFTAYGDIVIKNGGSLTITCELEMPAGAKIIVEPGGKLIVDGGTIINSCGDFWGGIEVKGNAVSSQYLSNGTIDYYNVGYVSIKNASTIRNARTAILRKGKRLGTNLYEGGGIVRVENSDLVNNQYGVYMETFEGIVPGTFNKVKDASYIINTDFHTTWAYPSTSKLPEHQVFLHATNGVDIINCNFYNTFSNSNARNAGLIAINSSANITGNEFNDLNEGVRLVNTYQSLAMRVENNKFDGCNTGTYSLRADNSLIVDNDFVDYLVGSTIEATVGFKHTENSYSTTTTNSNWRIGIATRNLSAASNQLYKNYFKDTDFGIFSSGSTPYSNQGLTYKCNVFEPNKIDLIDMYVGEGEIDKVQGACKDQLQNATEYPSGNALSHTCSLTNSDIEVYPALKNKITYAHHFEASSGPYTPDCYNSTNVFADECLTSFSQTYSCPLANVFAGSKVVFATSKQTVASAYHQHKDGFNNSKTGYDNVLDGGSTLYLLAAIDSIIGNGDSVNVFLKYTSPLISDEVLDYCMNHPIGLSGIDLKKVLIEYSPLSLTLAAELPNLSGQLSANEIIELQNLQNGLSVRDELENEIRFHGQQAELALNEMMSLFLYDTTLDTINQPQDSMLVYLLDWNSNWAKEQMVNIYWQKEEYATAQQVITDLSTENHYENTVTLLQKMHDAFSNDTDIFALLPDTVLIDTIAKDTTKKGYALARGLMLELTGKQYSTTFTYDGITWSRSALNEENSIEEITESLITVYPNPNKGQFMLEGLNALLNSKTDLLHLYLFDTMGKMVVEQPLESANEVEVLLPADLHGVYHLKVVNSNGQQFVTKLILND